MTTTKPPVLTERDIKVAMAQAGFGYEENLIEFARIIEHLALERAGADAVRNDEEPVQTLTGTTWLGMPVAAWVWDQKLGEEYRAITGEGDNCIRRAAFHWSTGPSDAERTYRESDVRRMLAIRALKGTPAAVVADAQPDMALILKALKSAQNNLASHRPHGSSDPDSDDYDHDAFMWDYYQRAIDAAAPPAGQPSGNAGEVDAVEIQLPSLPPSFDSVWMLTEGGTDRYPMYNASQMEEFARAAIAASKGANHG